MDVSETTDQLLDDDRELDGEDVITATMTLETVETIRQIQDADPVHLAKCAECATAVRYRSNVTGTGFFLVDEAPEASFGIGENGRPVCPNGHGEMSIADDKIPTADAFSEVAAMQVAVQRSLPGVFPAFNFQGAYMELEQQAIRVDQLHKEHKAAAEEARDAKKAWDSAAELYTSMALTLRQRRREKDEPQAAAAADAAATSCTWEAKHEGQSCPLCRNKVTAAIVERILGIVVTPPDAAAHADEVQKLLDGMSIDDCEDALEAIDTFIDREVIAEWSEADRAEVTEYARYKLALDTALQAGDPQPMTVTVERPAVLGKPHIPAASVAGEHQVCSICEVVIHAASDEGEPFKETDYVGVNCPGKVVEAPRYPETKKGKKAASKPIAPQPKPKAKKKGNR